jgi:hypothetical protein
MVNFIDASAEHFLQGIRVIIQTKETIMLSFTSPAGQKSNCAVARGISSIVVDGFEGLRAIRFGSRVALFSETRRWDLLEGSPCISYEGWTMEWSPLIAPVPLRLEFEETLKLSGHSARNQYILLDPRQNHLTLKENQIFVIGRHPKSDLRLNCTLTSLLHCALWPKDNGVWVIDLESANGLLVDGLCVREIFATKQAGIEMGRNTVFVKEKEVKQRQIFIDLPSAKMQHLYKKVDRVAPTAATVFIQGESGVGKEAIAWRIHRDSQRSGDFVAMNVATLRPQLASSQLFGHIKGAFTGAQKAHRGVFVQAHQGTLFLDEIADLDMRVQAELLRVLEQNTVRPLGSEIEIQVNTRIIAASHKDLASCVREGTFREDLLYRLWVVPLEVPPLRERLEDIRTLTQHHLKNEKPPMAISDEGLRLLERQPWNGNVRELLNLLRRACVLNDTPILKSVHLQPAPLSLERESLEEMIQSIVSRAYELEGNNVRQAARRLRVSTGVITKYLKREIDRPRNFC